MAEAFKYSREDVYDNNNNVAGTALFRTRRGVSGAQAEFRGTRGRVNNGQRTVAARAAARAARGSRYNRNRLTRRIYGR